MRTIARDSRTVARNSAQSFAIQRNCAQRNSDLKPYRLPALDLKPWFYSSARFYRTYKCAKRFIIYMIYPCICEKTLTVVLAKTIWSFQQTISLSPDSWDKPRKSTVNQIIVFDDWKWPKTVWQIENSDLIKITITRLLRRFAAIFYFNCEHALFVYILKQRKKNFADFIKKIVDFQN